jgi:tRNA1Val (adenine37-N6)-methyltransferase
MEQSVFRFKQFGVAHDKCAMKVNTDGVLLGAWGDVSEAKRILDVGTGTGVIALMMAQKNAIAEIHAIDVDNDAYLQAKENFENSKWASRLTSFHSSLQEFNPGMKYDVIISNPPYFIDDLKTSSHRKNVAKHTVALTYEELLFNLAVFRKIANEYRLFVTGLTEVTAVAGKAPYLLMLQLEQSEKDILNSSLTIQHAVENFTEEYKMMTKDFYLKF